MFSPPQKSNKEEAEVSPTVQYFIEKAKGNHDLQELEKAAFAYIAKQKSVNPADKYFAQKLSDKNVSEMTGGRGGFIPFYMTQSIAETYAKEAMKYVRENYPEQIARHTM